MSAQGGGRQSPDPEHQSDAQQGSTSDNVNKQGGAPKEGNAEEVSDTHKKGLSSNPTHPLEKHSEETTSKKV